MEQTIDHDQLNATALAVIQTQITYIKDSQDEMKKLLSSGYVTIERVNNIDKRLSTIESAVRWFIGIVTVSLVAAIAKVILK